MAEECYYVLVALDLVMDKHLDSSTDNQLKNVMDQLTHVLPSLVAVEKAHPENWISVQLRALFMEALNEIYTICSHMNDQAGETSDTIGMISKLLKMIQMENIAERIKYSKPSRSSSLIMIEMVGSVVALLDSFGIILCLLLLKHHSAPSTFVLKNKLKYLKAFVTLTANWCIEHKRMKDLFTHAEDVAYSALHLCFFLATYNMEEDDDLQARVLDCEFSKLLERISPFRPELRQIYLSLLIGSKSSQSETTMSVNFISDLVYGLKEDLKELLSRDASLKVTFDNRIPWLQQGLSYLYGFLRDIVSERIPLEEFNSLQPHIEALAIEAAIVIYSSCYNEDMDTKTTEIDHVLFLLQLKFNHVTVYVHLIKLLNSEAAIISPLGNLIDYVREELALLGTFLMVLLDQCKEQPKITVFLTLIQSVIDRAWSVIDSLSHYSMQEDLACKINRLHFELLLKFKFIRAASRQTCPNVSASSTLNHPTINLLNFLPLNFKVIDTYFGMLKSSKAPSSQSPKMDEILMGFREYILDTLLLKDETYLTFTVANEIKKYYYGLLLLVIYLVDPPVESIGCMKHNDFLTGFGTIAIDP